MGDPDPINAYGTSLALELLPYWTKGRIGSMEGLYFESSATTSFHFLTVSELAAAPVEPGARPRVRIARRLRPRCRSTCRCSGVRYYMAWTPEAQAKADAHPDLDAGRVDRRTATVSTRRAGRSTRSTGSELVQGLPYEPVVAQTARGHDVVVLRPARAPTDGTRDPELGAWECTAAGWFKNADAARHAVGRSRARRSGRASTAADLADAPAHAASTRSRSPTSPRTPTRSRSTSTRWACRSW